MSVDKDVLETLTPEERAAIEDSEYSPEELASMKGIAEDGPGDDADDDGDPVPSKTTEDPGPVAADPEEGDEAAPVPTYNAQLPADYDDQVASLKAETRALADKFKAGELDFDDYQTQLDQLNERRDQFAELRLKASISEEMKEQTQEQQWHASVKKFVSATARVEGIDYSKDVEKQSDLDTFVKSLAANPKNADKSFDWFLVEAHKRVKALHGIEDRNPGADSAAAKKDDPPAKPTRKPPIDSAPKTLAHVPGSDGPGDVGGEFADLDALEGMELEQALAKLSPAQRDRYLLGE